jgi:hypothetical protein
MSPHSPATESLRILITNHDLSQPGGTQLYTVDLARALAARGHAPCVFSPRPGIYSDLLRQSLIPVVSRLDDLGEAPDVVHGHHLLESASAILRFPRVPAVFVCHGWFPWQETPPLLPRIHRYVAVDRLRRDRLVNEHGVPPERVEVLPNFVDLERFAAAHPRPTRAERALVLSNGTRVGPWVRQIRAACESRGIALSVVGAQEGNAVADSAPLLAAADVVFARGRAAIEAAATGAFVVLCDREGLGPVLTLERAASLREANFGMATLRDRHADVGARLDDYSTAAAAAVAAWVRSELGADRVVDRLVSIYRLAIDDQRASPPTAAVEEMALARLFERVNGILAGHDAVLLREQDGRVALENHRQTRWHRLGETLASRVPGFWRLVQ